MQQRQAAARKQWQAQMEHNQKQQQEFMKQMQNRSPQPNWGRQGANQGVPPGMARGYRQAPGYYPPPWYNRGRRW